MSLNKMTVFREIRPGDDPVMAEIIRSNLRAVGLDIPGTAYYDDNLNHLSDFYLADKTRRYYCIAEEDGKVIGGTGLAEIEYFEDCAELQKLYLTDVAKGKGLGYSLIEKIEYKARELGYKRIYLETHTDLKAAIHIYKKCGYKEIEKPSNVVHETMNLFLIKSI